MEYFQLRVFGAPTSGEKTHLQYDMFLHATKYYSVFVPPTSSNVSLQGLTATYLEVGKKRVSQLHRRRS